MARIKMGKLKVVIGTNSGKKYLKGFAGGTPVVGFADNDETPAEYNLYLDAGMVKHISKKPEPKPGQAEPVQTEMHEDTPEPKA